MVEGVESGLDAVRFGPALEGLGPATYPGSATGFNVCRMCGHVWKMNVNGKVPKVCPSCRSTLWNRQGAKEVRCVLCGHSWTTMLDEPLRCPSCKSKRWNRAYTPADTADPYQSDGRLTGQEMAFRRRMLTLFDRDTLDALHRSRSMREKEGVLVGRGMTVDQSDVVILFDGGVPIPEIASRMSMSVSDVMDILVPYMDACEARRV
ncbi:MAG: hypothetical protein IJ856_04410 [Candidatus Methanomethylophilaceae archaeon]|nr:hypothetical protein [Candidatus Methanomethylophilaceae archaeon]